MFGICRVIVGASGSPGSLRALHDLPVQAVVERGEPGCVLVAIACPEDLLIVGAGRRGALAQLVAGRVTGRSQQQSRVTPTAGPADGASEPSVRA